MKRLKIVMINTPASPKMPYDGPPLSILSAVSMVDQQTHEICVLDWHYPDFESRIRMECRNADICGITCMTGYQIKTMLETTRIIKEVNPKILTVCGGCHPTLMPQQTLEHPLIDMIVIGQGPRTFSELIYVLATGGDISAVKGLGFKRTGRFVFNDERPRENINNFPAYPYHLLENFETFLVTTSFAEKTLYYLTGEGCTGKCKFCAEESLYHRRWHSLAVDRVIAEIRELRDRYHFDGVAISDSNFYISQQRVIEFCEKIKPLNLKWGGTSGRPDQLRKYQDSTFALMKASGLHDLFLGVESSDNNTLALMAKGAIVEDAIDVIPRLYRHGIRVQCSFIIGVPGVDVRKDLKSTMAFINHLRRTGMVAQFHLFVYTPLPGTGFLADAIRLGYQLPQNLTDWCHYELHAHITPWVPRKYAEITDACSIYFMFLAGHARKVIRSVLPRGTQWMGVIAERMMYFISLFRISTCCFTFPIEYRIIKWVLLHKDRFFGDKKLMF